MKFISSAVGRCLNLFSWEEVRPAQGIGPTMLAAALVERFGFQGRPTFPLAPDGIAKFTDGAALIDGTVIAVHKVDSYSDGLGVDCTNTDYAQLVMDELFKWARSDLGFRDFTRPPKVILISHITVEFAPGFENIFKSWKKIQALLNGSVQGRYGFDKDIDMYRLQWRGDPHTIVNNLLVSDFWIERKAGEPHTENRWHCSGPIPTQELIDLMGVLEGLALEA